MKLLLFTGPSGGHLFPALAFAVAYRKKHPMAQCALVITPKVSSFLRACLLRESHEVFYLPDFPFPRIFSLKALLFLLKLAQGFFKSWQILDRTRPDVIVAFGTFVSFPGVILGYCKNIPTVLHEQNVELGRANRMLIPFATKVAISFPTTLEKLPKGKGVWVGNILRSEMIDAVKKRVRREGKTQILILGGSQGSSHLNHLIPQTFKLLSAEEKQKIAVVHITGVPDFPKLEHVYDDLGIENEVFSFTDEMPGFYGTSHLVIARAGAGTIAEAALFGLPSILIPYPHAGSHQIANARYLAERNATCLLREETLTPESLRNEMVSLLHDEKRLQTMSENISRLAKPDAVGCLVGEIERLLNNGKNVRRK